MSNISEEKTKSNPTVTIRPWVNKKQEYSYSAPEKRNEKYSPINSEESSSTILIYSESSDDIIIPKDD